MSNKRTNALLKKKPVIYVAAPYTVHAKEQKWNIEHRVTVANRYAAYLCKKRFIVFSPLSMSHPLMHFGCPSDKKFWQMQDSFFLNKCDELHVLDIDGWELSSGLANKIQMAKDHRIPIKHINPISFRTKK